MGMDGKFDILKVPPLCLPKQLFLPKFLPTCCGAAVMWTQFHMWCPQCMKLALVRVLMVESILL